MYEGWQMDVPSHLDLFRNRRRDPYDNVQAGLQREHQFALQSQAQQQQLALEEYEAEQRRLELMRASQNPIIRALLNSSAPITSVR